MRLSIVIPIFNEEENLATLGQSVSEVLDTVECSSEVILVDDGSRDESFSIIRELCERDVRFKAIRLSRNFGQTAAMAV